MTTTHIGKYELVRRLGGGGMAEVFLAKVIGVEGFARTVAIKRVLPHYSADANFSQMFINEARLSAKLEHANIVSTTDFNRDDEGRLFIVMELIAGKDLDALEQTGPLPLAVLIYILIEVLRGLGAAHDAVDERGKPLGIVHRDVSPHNVLLSWSGAVKVSDFGIAKAYQQTGAQQSGIIKGKASYMSPEQVRADALDGRSDIFAVGVMAHQLLTGRPVFPGDSVQAVLTRAIEFARNDYQLPWPHQLRPEVPVDLSTAVMTMLARDRDGRYAHARDAIAVLQKCRDAALDGQDQLARVLAERFAADAPARQREMLASNPAGMREPPRPSMGSSPNQATWIASSAGAIASSAGRGTSAPAGATYTTSTSADSTARRSRWPLGLAVVAVAAGGIALAVAASRGSGPGVAPGATGGTAEVPAVPPPLDAPVERIAPDAPLPAVAPADAPLAAPPADAALPVDAGARPRVRAGAGRGSGSGSNRAGSAAGPGSDEDAHIQVLKIGSGT